jgi:hypothetical protein
MQGRQQQRAPQQQQQQQLIGLRALSGKHLRLLVHQKLLRLP